MPRTANPALNEQAFEKAAQDWAPPTGAPVQVERREGAMTLSGTIWAAAALLAVVVVAGGVGWSLVERDADGTVTSFPGWIIVAALAGLGVAILTVFKPHLARFTAPVYSILQGLVVGAISAVYEAEFEGIVLQAVGLTLGVLAVMLFLYATRIIKVTEKLRMGIVGATMAIVLVYLVSFVAQLFGADVGFIHDSGTFGIIFSLVVVGVAAFNFLLDFDLIERGVKAQAPAHMEWYAAFGLIVTLIWLYLEMLRLLAKLRSE
jgi:uncharacterized YccA/Bax inhibitor family protein